MCMRMAWNGPIHKHWNLICWQAPFIKSFSKGIKIALKENTLIFFAFSGLQFPGQTACKTCCCNTYGQLIGAESSRQVFSICFEIQENQPAANISQKSQIPTNSGMKSLQHQHRAPLPTLCPTGSCIPLLHFANIPEPCEHTPQLYGRACEHTQFIHCVAKESSIYPDCPRARTLKELL